MSFVSLVIFIIFLVVSSLLICLSAKDHENTTLSCLSLEMNTLLKFKITFSDPSDRLSSWNKRNIDCCKWQYIKCDKITGHVISVDLRNDDVYSSANKLSSETLDSSIVELKRLRFLDLSGNDFKIGSIPAFIGSMNHLQHLNLSHANFSGAIPRQLGNLSRLSVLDLSYNGYRSLYADDFTWVSYLSSLTHLDMSYVYLGGTKDMLKVLNLLPSIAYLGLRDCGLENINLQHACLINNSTMHVKYLDLSSNSFHGGLPCFLENMISVRALDLSKNNYDSCKQFNHLGRFINLVNLDLSHNSFECNANKIFEFLPHNCNLKSLSLGKNSFSGDVSIFFRLNSSKCFDRKLAFLGLTENHFYGQLPEEIGGFTKLAYLDLGENLISGPIPSSISNLSALTTLRLRSNEFNGSIPSSITNLTSLVTLRLSSNKFSGPIMSSLSRLAFLKILDLSYNQLSGEIPPSLGQLQNLEFLFIQGNYFHGTIAEPHFALLSKLHDLAIGNDFTKLRVGSDWMPPFMLRYFWIKSCEIGGQFPKWLQTQKELKALFMSDCTISGPVPEWLWHGNLTYLDLSKNRLTGLLPDSIPELMSHLDLSNNCIEGSLPVLLCEMNSLTYLDLSINRLSGNIPECWGSLNNLQALTLSSNRFSGVIPNSIGGAYSLAWLQLSNNSFTGKLPSSLKNCTQLRVLDIGQNKVSGKLPQWIGKSLLSLQALRLTNNEFQGTIPFQLCQLTKLKILDLKNNNLTGNIPRCFGNFSSMIILELDDPFVYVSTFSLQVVMKGVVLEYIKTLKYVVDMDLSNNDLVGEIPEELTRLVALKSLNLSNNHLVGTIPGGIGGMKWLESLDLSNNNLLGYIPESLSNLNFLSSLNLSYIQQFIRTDSNWKTTSNS